MPNHGRSGRCLTCKSRRVKCDEMKPTCSPCKRLGLDCGGYLKTYTFRDESHKYATAQAETESHDLFVQEPGRSLAAIHEELIQPGGSFGNIHELLQPGQSFSKSHESIQTGQSLSKPHELIQTGQSLSKPHELIQHGQSLSIHSPSRSLITSDDVAVPFWLVQFAGTGRSLTIARGFYEVLIPAYSSQLQNSPLALAVSVVATRIFSRMRGEHVDLNHAHNKAVASVRSALEHPSERSKPATSLAVLTLHLYESVSAVFDARPAMPVHHRGALSLLPLTALDNDLISTHVKGFILHTEVSAALRQKRPLHPDVYFLSNSPLLPGNASSNLDTIGASIAELQADYECELSRRHEPSMLLYHQCRSWIVEAGEIDQLLRAWERDMPDHLRPIRLVSGQDFDPSIAAYLSIADIYPSCQVATLWNLWRCHRLLVLKIVVGATHILNLPQDQPEDQSQGQPEDRPHSKPRDGTQGQPINGGLLLAPTGNAIQAGSIPRLVDEICQSVPFYLGNRTKPSGLNAFSDTSILFPSHHSLKADDARIGAWYQDGADAALSTDEHHRHMVAYGTWHVMSPLSNLLALFSDDHGGRLLSELLRPGQQEWLRQQFLRVGVILHLPRNSGETQPVSGAAEGLAMQVRKGVKFMSGP